MSEVVQAPESLSNAEFYAYLGGTALEREERSEATHAPRDESIEAPYLIG